VREGEQKEGRKEESIDGLLRVMNFGNPERR
jgi:hypothetical protein